MQMYIKCFWCQSDEYNSMQPVKPVTTAFDELFFSWRGLSSVDQHKFPELNPSIVRTQQSIHSRDSSSVSFIQKPVSVFQIGLKPVKTG